MIQMFWMPTFEDYYKSLEQLENGIAASNLKSGATLTKEQRQFLKIYEPQGIFKGRVLPVDASKNFYLRIFGEKPQKPKSNLEKYKYAF